MNRSQLMRLATQAGFTSAQRNDPTLMENLRVFAQGVKNNLGEQEAAPREENLPCPFCGHKVDLEDDDTLYPSGTYWREEEDGLRHYVNHKERRLDDKPLWGLHCPEPAGGCGIKVYGHTREEAIERWNRRAQPQSNAPGVAGEDEYPNEAAIKRMTHDFPILHAFYFKYAIGEKSAHLPSCLCCGQPTAPEDIAVKHAELADIFVCNRCKPASQPHPTGDKPPAGWRKYARHYSGPGEICESLKHSDYPCTCGLEALLAGDTQQEAVAVGKVGKGPMASFCHLTDAGRALPQGKHDLFTHPPEATALAQQVKAKAVEICREWAEQAGKLGTPAHAADYLNIANGIAAIPIPEPTNQQEESKMGDMSTCKHGGHQGYCDICSPGWEMDLIKADAADKIYQRGFDAGAASIPEPRPDALVAMAYNRLKNAQPNTVHLAESGCSTDYCNGYEAGFETAKDLALTPPEAQAALEDLCMEVAENIRRKGGAVLTQHELQACVRATLNQQKD
jgi:hypothetical protein